MRTTDGERNPIICLDRLRLLLMLLLLLLLLLLLNPCTTEKKCTLIPSNLSQKMVCSAQGVKSGSSCPTE